jgi:pilus assembly protein CpaE
LNTAEIKNNKVIGVIAPKGGVGASSLTLNLAICLRKYHKKDVIAAELRPGQGTWAIDLGLENPKSLNRLLKMKPGEISSNNIENELMQTPFGVRLLMASNNLEDTSLVNAASQMEMVLQFLAGLGSILLLDIGANILPNIDQVLDLCREVIMVVEPHPGTIERAKS